MQGQNEDPTCPNPDDCFLFSRTEFRDINGYHKHFSSKDLRRLVFTPYGNCDSVFVKICTERDKGNVLDIIGKVTNIDIENSYIDFGTYGKKYINVSTGYDVNIDFDLMQPADKDKFVFLTIRAVDITGTKRDMRVRQIGKFLETNSSLKSQLKFNYTLNGKLKAINSPNLFVGQDPSRDGVNDFAADEFAQTLHYHEGNPRHDKIKSTTYFLS